MSTNQATGFTLQLQGLPLELTTPLLSHVELSGGGKGSSDKRSSRGNCTNDLVLTLGALFVPSLYYNVNGGACTYGSEHIFHWVRRGYPGNQLHT